MALNQPSPLVIVHLNMLDKRHESYRDLAQRIRDHAEKTLRANQRVYLLPVYGFPNFENDDLFSRLNPLPTIVPQDPIDSLPLEISLFDVQFIRLKMDLIANNTQHVDLAGVARWRCVDKLDKMLKGDGIKPAIHSWMKSILKHPNVFDDLVKRRIETDVIEELCLD